MITSQIAFLVAAISTPLGTLVSYPLIDRIAKPTPGILLAVSALVAFFFLTCYMLYLP